MEIVNGKIKIEAYLHSMKAGEPTAIKYDGKVFVLEEQPTETKQIKLDIPEQTKTIPEQTKTNLAKPEVLDKGKKIAKMGTNSVHENVANAVREAVNNHASRKAIIKEIKKFHPQAVPSSHDVYYSVYIRYLYSKDNKPDYLKVSTRKAKSTKKPKSSRKHKRRKPKGAAGFDEKYNTWIKEDEYNKVNKVLHMYRLDFVASSELIAKETGLKRARVNAILNYMKENNEIFKKNENGTPVYKPTY